VLQQVHADHHVGHELVQIEGITRDLACMEYLAALAHHVQRDGDMHIAGGQPAKHHHVAEDAVIWRRRSLRIGNDGDAKPPLFLLPSVKRSTRAERSE
jgi:hypothetical protein